MSEKNRETMTMGTPRRIKKKSGYPTTDEQLFQTYKEAAKHQADLDLIESCEKSPFAADDVKDFIMANSDVIQEYVKQHAEKQKQATKKKKESKDKE